jgi:hypothetical protein
MKREDEAVSKTGASRAQKNSSLPLWSIYFFFSVTSVVKNLHLPVLLPELWAFVFTMSEAIWPFSMGLSGTM